MTQFRNRLVWLLVIMLVGLGFSSNSTTFAEDTSEAEQATVAIELNVETPKRKRLIKPKGTSSFLDLIFSSRNKAKAKANIDEADPAENGQEFEATHQQVALLKVTRDDSVGKQSAGRNAKKAWGVKSFCLDSEDNLLVAVGDATTGQLQLLDPQGERKQSWDLPVIPEAINVDPNGNYLVAGAGKIMKLDTAGEILREAPSPLIDQLKENNAEIRLQVIKQMKARTKSMAQQRDRYQQRIDSVLTSAVRRLDRDDREEYSLLQKRLKKFSEADASKLSVEEQNAWALRKVLFRMLESKVEQKLAQREIQMRDIYQKQMRHFDEMAQAQGSAEPTEAQIEASLKSMIAYKSRVASISAVGSEVFVATGSAQGYGYDVWRFDENLEKPVKIVSQLRGCCGQMDVQACEAGLFVAENSRHQVRHFDREGEKVNEWGSRARSGVTGFGSCCNPMNVAFGPDGTVYTAESNSGRIKRFSSEGQLMELVGSVELVPGCKKVSIAVTQDHQRVYMLDITRNHIIVMEAKPEEPQVVSKEDVNNPS